MNKIIIAAVGSAALAVVSLAATAVSTVRYNRMIKKMSRSVKDIEEVSSERITEFMIRKAVEKSSDERIEAYLKDTEDEVLRSARRSLDSEARKAVEECSVTIRDQVSERISQQVAALDIEQLKRRVCDRAETHVIEKLDDCLDKSVKKFNDQLENTRKVYDSIAKAMEEKEKKETGEIKFVLW